MNLENKSWYIIVENQHEQMPVYENFFNEKNPSNRWHFLNGYAYGFIDGLYQAGRTNGVKLSFEEFKKYILKQEETIYELW